MKSDKKCPSYYQAVTEPTFSEAVAISIENLQKEINSMYREILDLKRRISVLESITKKEVKDEH